MGFHPLKIPYISSSFPHNTSLFISMKSLTSAISNCQITIASEIFSRCYLQSPWKHSAGLSLESCHGLRLHYSLETKWIPKHSNPRCTKFYELHYSPFPWERQWGLGRGSGRSVQWHQLCWVQSWVVGLSQGSPTFLFVGKIVLNHDAGCWGPSQTLRFSFLVSLWTFSPSISVPHILPPDYVVSLLRGWSSSLFGGWAVQSMLLYSSFVSGGGVHNLLVQNTSGQGCPSSWWKGCLDSWHIYFLEYTNTNQGSFCCSREEVGHIWSTFIETKRQLKLVGLCGQLC